MDNFQNDMLRNVLNDWKDRKVVPVIPIYNFEEGALSRFCFHI